MKFILEFNPWKDKLSNYEIEDLKDFCNGYLVYLIDEGYFIKTHQNINLSSKNEFGITKITITNGMFPKRYDFRWEDVKDYMIPFFVGLSKSYNIKKISFLTIIGMIQNSTRDRIDILIDGTIVDDEMIKYIDRSIKDDDLIGYIDINITTLK